jgi:hypothetical protein
MGPAASKGQFMTHCGNRLATNVRINGRPPRTPERLTAGQ